MRFWIRSAAFLVLAAASVFYLAGCESEAQTDALIGGAVGAGAGQLIGGDTTSTVIGGAVGAGAGYAYGKWAGKDKENGNGDGDHEVLGEANKTDEGTPPRYDQDYGVNGENTVVVDVTNSDGTTTPVRLVRQGEIWVGPRGETYNTFPTEEELRQRYGY